MLQYLFVGFMMNKKRNIMLFLLFVACFFILNLFVFPHLGLDPTMGTYGRRGAHLLDFAYAIMLYPLFSLIHSIQYPRAIRRKLGEGKDK